MHQADEDDDVERRVAGRMVRSRGAMSSTLFGAPMRSRAQQKATRMRVACSRTGTRLLRRMSSSPSVHHRYIYMGVLFALSVCTIVSYRHHKYTHTCIRVPSVSARTRVCIFIKKQTHRHTANTYTRQHAHRRTTEHADRYKLRCMYTRKKEEEEEADGGGEECFGVESVECGCEYTRSAVSAEDQQQQSRVQCQTANKIH